VGYKRETIYGRIQDRGVSVFPVPSLRPINSTDVVKTQRFRFCKTFVNLAHRIDCIPSVGGNLTAAPLMHEGPVSQPVHANEQASSSATEKKWII
jgi:hypothetical protein